MKTAIMIVFLIIALIAAAAFLFGYTLIRTPVRRREGKRHVACVGDSVTYGCALPLFFLRRYPAVLQRLLGSSCQVGVFAVNDRTLQNTGNKPFRQERAFRQSKAFMPDTVIILLGTNDSKDQNWISAAAFRQQYAELISEYRALPTKPRILICTVPCAFAPLRIFSFCTKEAMIKRIPLIAEEIRSIAEHEDVELIDLYEITEGRPGLFGPDGLHPSAKGAAIIAEAVRKAVEGADQHNNTDT